MVKPKPLTVTCKILHHLDCIFHHCQIFALCSKSISLFDGVSRQALTNSATSPALSYYAFFTRCFLYKYDPGTTWIFTNLLTMV
jgi:hypothetical protein